MKRYNALKKVKALPMNRQEYNDLRGWDLPADEDGSDEGYLTEDINGAKNVDGYNGYVSWTPKAMFDDQFYEADEQQVCTAPADPNHELTDDEIKTLASGGSLCDCCEIIDCAEGEHPVKEGDLIDFGSAIHLMKLGEKVARKGWNGKGMFLFLIQGSNDLAKLNGYGFGEMLGEPTFRDAIFMRTVDNQLVPWTVSQSDALAEDWCLA